MTDSIRSLQRAALCASVLCLLAACAGALDEESRLERARQAQLEGDNRAALIDLKVLLQNNPDLAEGRLRLGQVSLAMGDAADAETQLKRALQLGWPKADVLPALGEALLQQRKYSAVLEQVDPASTEDPQMRSQLLMIRARAKLGLERADEAEADFREAAAAGESVEILLGLADVARARGDFEGADRQLDAALALDKDSADAWLARGTLRLFQGRYAEAEQAFMKALGPASGDGDWIGPQHLPALASLVDALLAQGKIADARVYSDKLVAVFPKAPVALYQGGRVAYELGDLETAERYLQPVANAFPDSVRAKVLLGAINYRRGKFGQAEMYLSSAVATDPDDVQARKMLAQTRLALGNPLEARRALGVDLEGGEVDGEMLALAGLASLRAGDVQIGLRYLEESVAADPTNARLKLELAGAYLSAGQHHRAVALVEQVPDSVDTALQREQIRLAALWRDGEGEKALAGLEQMLTRHGDSPGANNFAANMFGMAGRSAEARKAFERAFELESDNAMALAGLAALDEQAGRPADAVARYQRAVQSAADPYPLLLALGQLHSRHGQAEKARETFRRANEANPAAVEPYLQLASLAAAAGDFDDARKQIGEARRRAPQDPRVVMALGVIALAKGEVDNAVKHLRDALALAPDAVDIRYNLAAAEYRAGRPQAARAELRRILDAEPGHIRASAVLAHLEAHDGRIDDARKLLQGARDAHPGDPAPWVAEGDIMMSLQRYAEAATAYDAALGQGMNQPLVLRAAQAREAAGRADSTEPLARWLEVQPADGPPRYLLAEIHHSRGETERAIAEYERLLASVPEHPLGLNNLAWLYQKVGNPKALQLAREAHRLSPENPAIMDTLGWLLLQSGELQEGLPLLRRAAEGAPDNSEIRYHLAYALARDGQQQEARKILDELLLSSESSPAIEDARKLRETL